MNTTIIILLAFTAGLIVATIILNIKPSNATKLIPADEVFNEMIIKASKSLPEDFVTKRKEGLKKLHVFYTNDGQIFYKKSELEEFIAWCLEEEMN